LSLEQAEQPLGFPRKGMAWSRAEDEVRAFIKRTQIPFLRWTRHGINFADALHLAKAQGCEAFVSFDQRIAAVANALSDVTMRTP
jgi:hypothetical protein